MKRDLDLPAMSEFGVRSPGHEGAGIVVKIGANVKNWNVGDRAGIKPVWDTCGKCDLCWSNKEAHCVNSLHAGLMRTGSYQASLSRPQSDDLTRTLTEMNPAIYPFSRSIHGSDPRRRGRLYRSTHHVLRQHRLSVAR
jgi:threonine dehydrogenase-like Zn-dependent dehydrogenase